MNNFFYVARFYPEEIIYFNKLKFSRNLSVNKKIKGILTALKFKNNICGCICSTAETPELESSSKKYKVNNLNLYTPYYHKSNIRLLSYLLNILSTTKEINKVYLKDKNSLFICWDFLPDTLIPLLLSSVPLKNIIMDIEEFIQKDPEANFFFKLFEKVFIKLIKFKKYFLASKNLIINKNALNLEINGFFAQSKKEENLILNKLNVYSKKNKKIKIFYTGRLDNNRGSDLLINLSKYLQNDKNFFLTAFTFGDYKIFCELKKKIKNKNVRLFFEQKRSFYIKNIIGSDISLNLLKSENFAMSSFPSKLIEYFLFSKTIISTVKIKNLNYKNFLITKYNSYSIYKKIKSISKKLNTYDKCYKKKSSEVKKNYSINNLQNRFKKIFYENT